MQINVYLRSQLLKFALVGILATVIQYVTLWIGVAVVRLSAPFSSTVGYALGAMVGYVMNYQFTFQSQKQHHEVVPRYFAVVGVGLLINSGLMLLFVQRWKSHYLLAQLITTCIGLFWNYSGSRLWAFKPKSCTSAS